MVTIDYLLTTVGKTQQELRNIVSELNIKGRVLIGNQGFESDSIINDIVHGCKITIFNMTGFGVSKNRNKLLSEASSEYVTFLDDDMYFQDEMQLNVEKTLESHRYNAVRFNVVSDNINRPIKLLTKQGYVGFRQLSSFGVCGIFYKRDFLKENNINFNEKIGPGTDINHGEDGLFNNTFLKHSKIYCFPQIAFHAKQIESTWHGKNRNLEKELISHGYIYYLLYGKTAQLMSIIFLMTHMRCFHKGTKFSALWKYMRLGIKKAKEELK